MKIEQLKVFLQVAGRYQVYSDGAGEYRVMPIPESAVLVSPAAGEQLSAQPDKLIYNNQKG